MGRLVGILFMVLGIWLGIEIFTQGMDGAFGGIFSHLSVSRVDSGDVSAERSPMQLIGDLVRDDLEQGTRRIEEPLDRVD